MILNQERRAASSRGDLIERVARVLAPRAAAILVRRPSVDGRFPDTSDLDCLVPADIKEFRSERLQLSAPDGTRHMIDVAWLPWAWFDDPEAMAARGWVPHRLLSSELLFDSGRNVARFCDDVWPHMYRPPVHQKRLGTFLEIGFQTVREIGITWDFPALALFWLHMAHAACLGALLDGMRRLCPNVYTRPFDYLDDVAWQGRRDLRGAWIETLHLSVNPGELIAALQRVHAIIAARFPEPDWPDTIGAGTRYEYRYWLSPDELNWRISVAQEMVRRSDSAAAIFHLRFCAYAIARLPMLHARACDGGHDVSFLRPEKAVLPELKRLVPEVIDDLNVALAGTSDLDQDAVKRSLAMLHAFREFVIGGLRQCGAPVPELKPWAPYEPAMS